MQSLVRNNLMQSNGMELSFVRFMLLRLISPILSHVRNSYALRMQLCRAKFIGSMFEAIDEKSASTVGYYCLSLFIFYLQNIPTTTLFPIHELCFVLSDECGLQLMILISDSYITCVILLLRHFPRASNRFIRCCRISRGNRQSELIASKVITIRLILLETGA